MALKACPSRAIKNFCKHGEMMEADALRNSIKLLTSCVLMLTLNSCTGVTTTTTTTTTTNSASKTSSSSTTATDANSTDRDTETSDDEQYAQTIAEVRKRNIERRRQREESMLPQEQRSLMRRHKLISNDTPEDRDKNSKAEYKRQVVKELTKHWHLMKGNEAPLVAIKIGRDGKILSTKVVESSGDNEVDGEVLKAINALKLPAFSQDIKSEKISMRIDFNRIVAKQQRAADKVLEEQKSGAPGKIKRFKKQQDETLN